MAIKPNDCIIKINSLVIGSEVFHDIYGHKDSVHVYEPYWENFLQHVKETTDQKEWNSYDINFEKQLNKFNATYKETKNYDDRYIKFKNHSDLTFFILRWA